MYSSSGTYYTEMIIVLNITPHSWLGSLQALMPCRCYAGRPR